MIVKSLFYNFMLCCEAIDNDKILVPMVIGSAPCSQKSLEVGLGDGAVCLGVGSHGDT